VADFLVDNKITQSQANSIMATLELDLTSVFKVMQEEYLTSIEGFKGTPEDFIHELGKTLQVNNVIEKAGKPVGTISDRKDGKYKKVGEGKWVKVTEGKPKQEEQTVSSLVDKWEQQGLKVDIYHDKRRNEISLSTIIVPKEKRGTGIGSDFMNELTQVADKEQATITLTPSTDYGASSKKRLVEFYKKFGFVENKGKNRDYEIKDDMYRLPEETKNLAGQPETEVPHRPTMLDDDFDEDQVEQIEEQRISDLMERIGDNRTALFTAPDGKTAIMVSPSTRHPDKFRVSFWQAKDGMPISPSSHSFADTMEDGVKDALGLSTNYEAVTGSWNYKLTKVRKSISQKQAMFGLVTQVIKNLRSRYNDN